MLQIENVSETDLNALINSWIDKDLFLKTILVDRRIAHDDGFLHWYNDEDDTYSNHNYYWYEDPNNDKVQLIPWDLDNAFENIASDRNPVTPIKDQWNETSSNCSGFRYGPLQIKQRSAACDKIIGSYYISTIYIPFFAPWCGYFAPSVSHSYCTSRYLP